MNLREILQTCKEKINTAHKNGYGGTSEPGEWALKMCPDILQRLSENLDTILVCGTNGKTTTCRMIANILMQKGIKCLSNRTGANLYRGIVTSFIADTDDQGVIQSQIAVIECDEEDTPIVSRILNPKCIVFTSLSEDQPYRFAGLDEVYGYFTKAIEASPEAVLCINQDNNLLTEFLHKFDNKKMYYSASEDSVTIDGLKYDVDTKDNNSIYNYDIAGACCGLKVIGLFDADSVSAAADTKPAFGRMEKIQVGKSIVIMELLKNPDNYSNIIKYLREHSDYTTILIACMDDRELGWIQEEKFGILKDICPQVYALGEGKVIDYWKASIPIPCMDYKGFIERCNASEERIFLLVEYYAMLHFRKLLSIDGYVHPFWED